MKTKQILFGMMFIVLLFPIINKNIPFIWSSGLKGAFNKTLNVKFTWETWFDGTYQQKKGDYFKTNVGFYPDFIRINNQIDFSFFGILHADDIYEGDENFLFGGLYIQSYMGNDKLHDSSILKDCIGIKWIQDTLTSRGKKFIYVIAPNKVDYYPAYLPEEFKHAVKKRRNYDQYRYYFDSLAITYIDFNGYFMEQKNKTPYPLITKFGSHWSSYGASVAADSIIRFFNVKYYTNRLIQPEIFYIESQSYNSHDQEAYDPLNLIVGWPARELTAWPQYKYPKNENTIMPDVLFLADSYFWELYDQKVMDNVFSGLEFWYYNREHWGKKSKLFGDAATLPNLGDNYLKNTEIVVMMASEFHLNCLTDDFIKKIKKVYKQP